MRIAKLIPAAGLKVRMEGLPGQPPYLPPEGQRVEINAYWLGHIKDGSVTEYKPATAQTKASATTKGE